MTGGVDDGFLIRTKSGDKGPFDLFQLEKLVAAGKIPRTISVIDQETGLALPLADLLPEPVADPPPAAQAAPAPPPPEAPAPAPTAPARAPTRRGRGPARKKARPVAHRPAPGAAPHRHHRFVGTPHKKSNVAPIVLIVLAVLVIGGGGGYVIWRDVFRDIEAEFREKAVGAYRFDLMEFIKLTPDWKNAPEAQRKIMEGLAMTMLDAMKTQGLDPTITITANTMTFTGVPGEGPETSTYKALEEVDGDYLVENIDAQGNRDVMRFRENTTGWDVAPLDEKDVALKLVRK